MKKIIKLLSLCTITGIIFQSCEKDNTNTPTPPPVIDSVVNTKPISLEEIDKNELNAIRNLAKLNGLEKDFESDNPTKWNNQHFAIDWSKNEDNKFVIQKIYNKDKQDATIKKLVIKNASKSFSNLEVIDLNTPNLEILELSNLPKLRKLSLTGSSSASVVKASLDILPVLDSLSLKKFPKLRTTIQSDNSFKLSDGYDSETQKPISLQPQLKYINLSDTGITDLYINGGNIVIEEIILVNNKSLDIIHINKAKLKNTVFTRDNYPVLRTLTLKNINFQEKPIEIRNLEKLNTLYIQDGIGANSVNIINTPNLTEANITGLGLQQSLNMTNADKLKNIDLSGNKLTAVNLSNLTALKTVTLNSNNFTSTERIKLPEKLEKLAISNNNKLLKADLSPYKKLKLVTITKSPLSELNIDGLKGLISLNVKENRLTDIQLRSTEFNILENIDISNNEISIENVARIAKSVMPSIKEEYLTETNDFKLLPQRGFTLPKEENGILNYSEMNSAFKNAGFTNKTFYFEFLDEDNITIDKENSIIKFHKPGNYFLYIMVKAGYTDLAFVERELITVITAVSKN